MHMDDDFMDVYIFTCWANVNSILNVDCPVAFPSYSLSFSFGVAPAIYHSLFRRLLLARRQNVQPIKRL